MAQVHQKYRLSATYVDAGLNETTISWDFNTTNVTTAAEAVTAGGAFLADYSAVTKAKLKQFVIQDVWIDDAFAAPTAAAEVEEKATLTLAINGVPNKKATLKIPAPVEGIFAGTFGSTNYNIVDGADAALVAVLQNFFPAADLMISDGESIPTTGYFIKGKRTHHRSNKG